MRKYLQFTILFCYFGLVYTKKTDIIVYASMSARIFKYERMYAFRTLFSLYVIMHAFTHQ